jgi:hypothetical protein
MRCADQGIGGTQMRRVHRRNNDNDLVLLREAAHNLDDTADRFYAAD